MRLGLMGTTDDGKRAATLLGTGALCAATYLIDILCAGLNDPGSAALTANVALPLDLMVVALLAFWITYVRPRGKSLTTASLIIRYEVPSRDAQPYREGERLRRQGLCRGLRACCPEATSRDGVGHVTGMWDRRAGMGARSVPERVRATRPGGTTARAIGGHHCACGCRSAAEGGRRTRMGRCVGKAGEGRGYVPDPGRASGSGTATPGSGDWAVAPSASAPVRGLLGERSRADDADRIWALARVSCVRGVTPAGDARRVRGQSAPSLALPSVALGERDRGEPPGALGRRRGPPLASGRALAEASSRLVAACGRVVGSGSLPDDLAGKGCRLGATHCDQTGLPVA